MKKKILLCISGNLGLKVYKLLKKKELDIDVYCSNPNLKFKKNYFYIKSKKSFNNKLYKSEKIYNFIILVYWPWIVEKKCFSKFLDSINFHPSLLPFGRGWYPHVHSKIKKFPYGVTLHSINHGVDTGKIWCQKVVKIPDFCTSDQIYKIAQKKIYQLFKKNFIKILNKNITNYKQNVKKKYLSKDSVSTLDRIDLNKKQKILDFINHIRIRMFKDKSFCYFLYKNKKKFIKIVIN